MVWRMMQALVVVALSVCAGPGRAGQPAPAPAANPTVITDWTPHLNDFVSSDKAKQDAAAQVFVEQGSRGYAVLAPLLKHNDPAIAKRAGDVRQEIEKRSFKMYQEVAVEHGKLQRQPLTAAALESVRQAYIKMGMYASQNTLKQFAFQTAGELQKTAKEVEAASKQLATLDEQLKAAPKPEGLARAAIQVERAAALRALQRDAEMLAAAQDAAACSGKDGRFTPGALKQQLDAYERMEDAAKAEAAARAIIAGYPRSLEVKAAHRTLLQLLAAAQRWDDAAQQARAFLAAFPVDEEAQEAVYGLLETLMNEAREYVRVAPVAEWLMETLPPDRLKPEVLKYWGGCSEYIMRDYTKAAQAYAVLRDRFMDAVSVEDMNSAIARVKQKAEGKFPKEPAENAAGPEGAFARFLKAARTRDSKAVKALVAKDVVEDFVERLGDSSEELLPSLVFADFIVRKTDLNADGNAAKLTIEHYDASSGKPKPLTEAAVQEDGQWKIRWEDPAEDDAPPGLQVQPAAEQKKDAAPAAKTDAKK